METYFAKMNVMAKMIGVSTQTVYRLMREGVLQEGKHYSRFSENGSVMFYIPEVVAKLKPENAAVYMKYEETVA